MKDYKSILAKYNFTDDMGHALENCIDYQELLQEIEDLRKGSSKEPEGGAATDENGS